MRDTQDYFNVLRKVQKNPEATQRKLAKDLGFSLGKLNYCLKALQQKGLIKIRNFQNQKNKLIYKKGMDFYFTKIVSFLCKPF